MHDERLPAGNRSPDGGPTEHDRIAGLEAQAVVDREILAEFAIQGLADRAEIAQLHAALISSRRIGAAMGILMATLKVDEAAAFAHLRATSQNANRKLREVADEVVFTGVTGPWGASR